MTLLEVLAAVLVLGMGLIMVAGAFPVGADQTRLAVEQTNSATIGRMALEICRSQKLVRNLTNAQSGWNVTFPVRGLNEPWRVWNGDRLFYLEPRDSQGNLAESAMWPPRSGDYLWRPFLTRLSTSNEAPLYRLTLVIVRYTAEANPTGTPPFVGWDLYNPAFPNYDNPTDASYSTNRDADPSNQGEMEKVGVRLYSCSGYTQRKVTCGGSVSGTGRSRAIKGGDYIMDRRTGLCYQVERAISGTGSTSDTLLLVTDPLPTFATNVSFYSFGNVVGIYHTLISE